MEESGGSCERKWEKRWEDAIIVEKIKVGVFSWGLKPLKTEKRPAGPPNTVEADMTYKGVAI